MCPFLIAKAINAITFSFFQKFLFKYWRFFLQNSHELISEELEKKSFIGEGSDQPIVFPCL